MKPGDKVAVLDDVFTGTVKSVDGNLVTLETTEGFLMKYQLNQVVKIQEASFLNTSTANFNLRKVKEEKEASEKVRRTVVQRVKGEIPPREIDLHIEKLTKDSRRMSSFDMLEKQLSTADYHIQLAIRNREPKIVFIHGVGDGVLKAELEGLLRRYEGTSYREASYSQYGAGAMEVRFRL